MIPSDIWFYGPVRASNALVWALRLGARMRADVHAIVALAPLLFPDFDLVTGEARCVPGRVLAAGTPL